MQPINYGAPIYPNCFDQLTTHGIVAEDVMGYITDQPSPYLQNYVAQRGWAPSIPGQVLPDPLPTMQPPNPLPRNDVYQTVASEQQNAVPNQQNINNYVQNPRNNGWKKAAAAILLTGLAAFGLYKFGGALKTILGRTPASPSGTPSWLKNIGTSISNMGTKVKNACVSGFIATKDFCKNIWSKITGHTPPGPTP